MAAIVIFHKKRLVRFAFLAVIGLCVVQVDLLYRIGEPYPGLIMPGFRGSGGSAGACAISDHAEAVFVLRDGRKATFTMQELFGQFPDSHHGHLQAFLAPLPEEFTIDRSGLRYRVFPGLHAGRLDRAQPAHRESLRRWMKQRANELLAEVEVERLEVIWYRDTHHFLSNERESEPTGRFLLDLQEPSR